jgi:hypothetical protein
MYCGPACEWVQWQKKLLTVKTPAAAMLLPTCHTDTFVLQVDGS